MAVKASNFITLTAVVDVSACFRYYLLQSSTLAKPTKPTAKPPGGSWTDAEPSYTAGSTNSLYFVDLTVFSDGTWTYSAVSLSSSYEAAKEAYNRAVAAQATAQQALSNTEVIVGTQTAATGAWTGVASFSSLQDGQQIVYWLPYAGSGSASLNLTLADGSITGAKPCYYSGSSRITTHYAAGNAIHLTYRVNANVNGTNYTGWWADANWNTDTTDRMRMYNSILAASAITAGYLIVGTSSGYSHLAGGITFDVNRPILYPGSAISSGSTGNNNYLSFPSVNLRNTMGSSWSGTTRATAYIAGSLNGTSFTTQSSGCITTSPTLNATIAQMLTGIVDSTSAITTTFSNGSDWSFLLVVSNGYETRSANQTGNCVECIPRKRVHFSFPCTDQYAQRLVQDITALSIHAIVPWSHFMALSAIRSAFKP